MNLRRKVKHALARRDLGFAALAAGPSLPSMAYEVPA
jgi:hypothetical protein